MGRTRTIFRRIRTLLWTALTMVALLAAILVGVGKLLMPYSVRYQPQLEEWLSRQFQQPVVVDSFTGQWKAFGPRISFEGVTLMLGNRLGRWSAFPISISWVSRWKRMCRTTTPIRSGC